MEDEWVCRECMKERPQEDFIHARGPEFWCPCADCGNEIRAEEGYFVKSAEEAESTENREV